jgi:hypothetical protein
LAQRIRLSLCVIANLERGPAIDAAALNIREIEEEWW